MTCMLPQACISIGTGVITASTTYGWLKLPSRGRSNIVAPYAESPLISSVALGSLATFGSTLTMTRFATNLPPAARFFCGTTFLCVTSVADSVVRDDVALGESEQNKFIDDLKLFNRFL